MTVYIIQGSDLEIYLLNQAECLSKLQELNAPYNGWKEEEDRRLARMVEFEEECSKNWKELRAMADSKKTRKSVVEDNKIEDEVRSMFYDQKKPWYLEMHPDYEQPLPCPNYYSMTEKTTGVIYKINHSDDMDLYEYED